MQKVFLKLAFDGSAYCGWQRQLHVPTVQAVIEDVLSDIYKDKITVMGCGRTDTGVHASLYYAHVELPEYRDYLQKAMQHFLPEDILLHDVIKVDEDAHARYDATERSYQYRIHTIPNVFIRNHSLFHPLKKIDKKAIHQACRIFEKYDNYRPLCRENPEIKVHNSFVKKAEWIELNGGENVIFNVTANRFLRNQIRRMVGCLIDIGSGRFSVADLEHSMVNDVELPYSSKVDPQGLFLTDIKYPYLPK
jgi:tRNA pseudouridine38-40 synthase